MWLLLWFWILKHHILVVCPNHEDKAMWHSEKSAFLYPLQLNLIIPLPLIVYNFQNHAAIVNFTSQLDTPEKRETQLSIFSTGIAHVHVCRTFY